MRVLGLDVGDRRVGVAVSDETGTIASPHGVYIRRSFSEDSAHFARLAQGVGARAIVVGLPLNMNGTEGEQARKTRELAEAVSREARLPLHYVDERLTSAEADRALTEGGFSRRKRKEREDALAAVLILQAWLGQVQRSPRS